MLTALSVARDCEIVPPQQKVIMVHTITNQGQPPSIYFTQSNSGRSPDTAVSLSSLFMKRNQNIVYHHLFVLFSILLMK
jgi:hypothetical protein